MAITPLLSLASLPNQTAYVGIPFTVGLTIENSEASSITVSGIQVVDNTGLFQFGDFGAALPAKYQVVSGGSPVTSSIPAWGTATQSNTTYYIGNISGSSLQTVVTSGSYGSANTNFTPVSSSVIIPAGATGSFQVGGISYAAIDFGTDNNGTLEGKLLARVSISGSATPIETSTTNIYLNYKEFGGIKLQLVGAPSIVAASQWARPEQQINFDAYCQATLIFADGTTYDAPLNTVGQLATFSSSAPSVVDVLTSGLWTSTAPSTTVTNSVGSIIGGQNTRVSGGAGALVFTGLSATQPGQVDFATIQATFGPTITGSFTIGLTQANITGLSVVPSQVSLVSGSIVDLNAFVTLDNGRLVELADGVGPGQPVWTSTDTTNLPIGVSGSVTGAVNTQATALITATLPGLPLVGTSTVTLNIIP